MDMSWEVEQAIIAGQRFAESYYECLDTQRTLMCELCPETGNLTWDGHAITGHEAIQEFYMNLPPSQHVIETIDAQPIIGCVYNGQPTFLLQVTGTVKYADEETPQPFRQTFVVV